MTPTQKDLLTPEPTEASLAWLVLTLHEGRNTKGERYDVNHRWGQVVKFAREVHASTSTRSIALSLQEIQDAIDALRLTVERDGVQPPDSWMTRYSELAQKLAALR